MRAIVIVSHGDGCDEHCQAARFGPVELRVLEIDVVNDFGQSAERGLVQAHAVDQHLECAAVAKRSLRFFGV